MLTVRINVLSPIRALPKFPELSGSGDGAVMRASASEQCGPGSIPARWVESVVGSRLAPSVFLRVLWFSSSTKTNISEFRFDQDRGPA